MVYFQVSYIYEGNVTNSEHTSTVTRSAEDTSTRTSRRLITHQSCCIMTRLVRQLLFKKPSWLWSLTCPESGELLPHWEFQRTTSTCIVEERLRQPSPSHMPTDSYNLPNMCSAAAEARWESAAQNISKLRIQHSNLVCICSLAQCICRGSLFSSEWASRQETVFLFKIIWVRVIVVYIYTRASPSWQYNHR